MSNQQTITKFTPILIVASIEDLLPFWRDQMGYKVSTEVPHEDKIGFVILTQGASEVMLQTRASLEADLPAAAKRAAKHPMFLYADVKSLDQVEKSLKGVEVIVPRRRTFYGAQELWIQEPSGNVIGFAEFSKE